jgi:hypothetical protein
MASRVDPLPVILLLTAKAFAPHPLPAIGIMALMAGAANWLAESKKLAESQKTTG